MQPGKPMLEGIRVADMSSVIFGPYCTQLLVDLGADVVKIEPLQGDIARTVGRPAKTPNMSKLHMTINRGKRSVNWDLGSPDGRRKIEALIASSDIFIHNIRASSVRKLGLDYETVRAINPEIIYVHCCGFDSDGPDAGQPAYDDIIQGGSGAASLLSLVDQRPEPRYLPLALADKVAGLYAAQATLAAIIHRLRTGEGQFVEVPMFETVTAFNLVEHLSGGVFPDVKERAGYARQLNPYRQPSPTADGYICIAPYTYDRWLRFFDVSGRTDLKSDERLTTADPARQKAKQDLLFQLLPTITVDRTTDEWLALLKEADIPAKRYNALDDLFSDPQLEAVKLFRERQHPTEGRYREVRSPIKFSARPDAMPGVPAHLGEHNAELEHELGLT